MTKSISSYGTNLVLYQNLYPKYKLTAASAVAAREGNGRDSHGEYRDGEVICDEAGVVPVAGEEDAPVGEEDDEDDPDQTPPGSVRLEPGLVRQDVGRDTLRLHICRQYKSGTG